MSMLLSDLRKGNWTVSLMASKTMQVQSGRPMEKKTNQAASGIDWSIVPSIASFKC